MMADDVAQIAAVVNLYGLAVDSHRRRRRLRPVVALDGTGPVSKRLRRISRVLRHDPAQCFCNGSWRLVRKAVDRQPFWDPLWDGTGWYDDTLVRTPGGWRISRRVCRITWWTGNPLVQDTIPGVKFELATTVAGRVGILNAL